MSTFSRDTGTTKDLSYYLCPLILCFPLGFFDGATQLGICGCGAILKINERLYYKLSWNGEPGTNTRDEKLALWGLLWFSKDKKVPLFV